MSIALQISLVFEDVVDNNLFAQPGIITQRDGSYLFGYVENYDTPVSHWYRSTDNGLTWQARGDADGATHNRPCAALNIRNDQAIWFANDTDFSWTRAELTANGAASWTTKKEWAWNGSNPFRTVITCGAALFDRSRIVIVGQFDGNPSNPRKAIAISDDGGNTWAESGTFLAANNASHGSAICNASGGVGIAAMELRPAFSYWPKLFRSTNNGDSWSQTAALTMPSNTNTCEIRSITAVTPQIIVAAGFGNSFPFSDEAYVFRSSDGGQNWSTIDKSNIANWANGDAPSECSEVKRITHDAVLLGISNTPTGTNAPWALSIDQGATYTIAPSVVSGSIPTQAQSAGAIVVARDGSILLPLFARAGSDNYHQVWRGKIVC